MTRLNHHDATAVSQRDAGLNVLRTTRLRLQFWIALFSLMLVLISLGEWGLGERGAHGQTIPDMPLKLVFGPRTYTLTTPEPGLFKEELTVPNPAASFTLIVENGTNGGHRATGAVILINGQVVVGPWQINPQVAVLRQAVRLQAQNKISVEVRGEAGALLTVSIVQPFLNTLPVAAAGSDQHVAVGDRVGLDGSGSSDADGDLLSFQWRLIAQPATSAATLADSGAVRPFLTVDAPGSYTAELIVTDRPADSGRQKPNGHAGLAVNAVGEDSAPDTVTISTANNAPVAQAGPDQRVAPGAAVALDGGGSTDVNGDPLTYRWTLDARPVGSQATLTNPTSRTPSFTVDRAGSYIAALVVNDGTVDSAPAYVVVTTLNARPVADGGPAQRALVGQTVTLDGGASHDADAHPLSYAWSFTTQPAGSTAILDPRNQAQTIFTPDNAGDYVAQLIVDDGALASAPATVLIAVTPNQPPEITSSPVTTATATQSYRYAVAATDPDAGDTLTYALPIKPDGMTITSGGLISWTPATSQVGGHSVQVRVTDSGGLFDEQDFGVTVAAAGGGTLPPDPETVAPPVDPTVATTTYAATQFLYTGSNPIQTGVAPGTIDPKRTAVLRGRVLDKQNNPLSGVTMTILNHPEFGQTLSRADGWFDLAVNGGGYLTVTYQKTGYLPAQRQVNAPWQDFVVMDDTVLIARDAQATAVDLTQPTVQVAQGSPVTDGDGTRQATLLIPPGTTAQVYNSDGSTRSVSSLTLRATEYTVGANGPASMPAPLPANVGYTYALELSADEATIKKDGKDVVFNQPVPFYVENFLNFPVGSAVPVGYYDSTKGAWIPYDNGRIIKILSISGGLAQLDVTGSGTPADAAALAALGITDAERAKLASLYAAGKSLWRVQLAHLSTWDYNWPFGPPDDAKPPQEEPEDEDNEDDPCEQGGSIVECENRTLGERIPLVGTSLSLNYRSDRVPGRLSARVLKIPLSGASIPASLKRIEASVRVAGRLFDLGTFPAQANQTTTFTWDGQGAYGQVLQGKQPATVKIGYVYDGVYQSPVRFGASSGVAITGNRTRQEITLWRDFKTSVGTPNLKQVTVAGWSLDSCL